MSNWAKPSGCYLALVAIVGELVGLEIVAHHISSQSRDMASGKGVVVKGARTVLHVAVFSDIFRCDGDIIALVILVEII